MNKRGAIELSMSTIVVLVLAMSMLILGLVLVKTIFSTAQSSITGIDKGVKSAISDMFADKTKSIAVYPDERRIYIKQGAQGEGFAFSIRNKGVEDQKYRYTLEADADNNFKICNINKATADGYMLIKTGTLTVPASQIMENPELVTFKIPETAHVCEIRYRININYAGGTAGNGLYVTDAIWLNIEPKE